MIALPRIYKVLLLLCATSLVAAFFAAPAAEARTVNGCIIKSHTVCRYKDLRFETLRGVDLRYSDFTGSKLAYANLQGANLTGATFNDTNMSGATLYNLRARNSRWLRADISGATLDNADFAGANLQDADIAAVSAIQTQFWLTRLVNADISGGADFSGSNFNAANLSGANANKQGDWATTMRGVQMRCIGVGGKKTCTNLSRANLEYVDFSAANLCGSITTSWLVKGANFSKTVMPNCKRHA